ncbi:MAG TPA: hypothetical protein PLW65_02620 [Pseudomonadota bacterium]|nr:hypothetical protein [Pseudomonadota bacterium]
MVSAEGLWAAIAKVLEMPAGARAKVWAKEKLKQSTTLLLLDDLNGLTPSALGNLLTQDLLVPGLTLIGTRRSPTFRKPAGLPAIPVAKLTPAAAADLFHARTDRHFVRDPNLSRILEAMDGMPLAIVLMAARAAAQKDLLGLWADWQESKTAMLAIAGSRDPKNNLNVCIRLSLTNLQEEGRPLLQILALLPDGLRRSSLPELHVKEAEANRLLDQALINTEGERILMLAPLREYVLADPDLKPDGEDHRALMYLRRIIEDYGPKIGEPGGSDSIKRLTEELRNLESVIGSSLSNPNLAAGATAALLGLAPFLRFSGLGDFRLLNKAASLATAPSKRGRCLLACADVALERALYDEAEDLYQRAEEAFFACGDDKLRVMCLIGRGHSHRYRCQHRAARELYARARQLCRRQLQDDRQELAHVHKGLGHLLLARDNPARAKLHYHEAERIFREEGLRVEAANCQRSLGLIACRQRDYQTAARLLSTAKQTLREAGDQRGEADCLQFLADVELAQEPADLRRAARYAEEARERYSRLQDARGQAQCKGLQARLQSKQGNKTDAIRLYREALALFEQKDAKRSMADTYAALADLCESPDERRQARQKANLLYSALELPRMIIHQ